MTPPADPAADAAIASFLADGASGGASQASPGSANPRSRRQRRGRSSQSNQGAQSASAGGGPAQTPQSAAPANPQPAATATHRSNQGGSGMPDPAARVARARTKMSTARDRVQEDVAAFGLAVAESEDLAQVVYNSSSKDGKKKIDEVFGRKNGKKSDTEGDEETGGSKKADSNLVKKVKQLKASGKSKGKIEDVLLKKGESPKAIDKAVAAVFKK